MTALIHDLERTVRPDKAFLDGQTPLTYGQLFDRLRRTLALLRQLGVTTGDRVLIVSADDAQVITLYLAMLCAGVTVVLVDPQSTDTELERLVARTLPTAAFADSQSNAWRSVSALLGGDATIAVADYCPGLVHRLLGRRRPGAADAATYHERLLSASPADLPPAPPASVAAHILLSSGTTAHPKEVVITHGNLFTHLDTLTAQFGYDLDTRVLNVLPMYHTDGLVQGPMVALRAGATVLRRPSFRVASVRRFLDAIAAEGVTHLYAVPSMLRLIDRLAEPDDDAFRGPDFRFVLSSAEELPLPLWRRFEERFGVAIVNVYGLTETVSGSLYCGPDPETRRIGTLGRPVDCQTRVVDETGAEVAAGTAGELWLQGPHISPQYLDPEATAHAFVGSWFRTGDRVVADETGFFTLVGRLKNIVIRGGVNISPEEIVRCLEECDGVLRAAALGVADPEWGEKVVALVVPASDEVTVADLLTHARAHLSPAKVPTELLIVPALPESASGKVDLGQLRQLVAKPANSGGVVPTADEVRAELRHIAAGCFKLSPERLASDARPGSTPGWDSLAHLELIIAIERRFEVDLSARDILSIGSLRDAETLLLERCAKRR